MNRRDLLKQFAAVPVAAAVALPAIADKGATLYSTAHPAGFTCVNGHPWCNRCVGGPLTEKSLEEMCRKLQASRVPIRQEIVADHEFHSDTDICRYCGATQIEVEEGIRPWCWLRSVPV